MKLSEEYHKWYEENRIWEKTTWLGTPMWKLPFDSFVMQEIIFNVQPDLIIETGTGCGGSSVFYASIMQLLNKGKVITSDIDGSKQNWYTVPIPIMNRIYPINGSSTDPKTVELVEELYDENETTMVILDSWHSYDHVLEEMWIYHKYVSKFSYMVVEDTHVNGHPVEWEHGKGPYEAVQEFLKVNDDFVIDRVCEKYEMTFNPGGYLRRAR